MHKPAPSFSSRSTPWQAILLVCGKCTRKIDGGFGHKQRETLRYELREALIAADRQRDITVFETKCLGLCPKGAVAVLNGGQPGAIYAVPASTSVPNVLAQIAGVPARQGT